MIHTLHLRASPGLSVQFLSAAAGETQSGSLVEARATVAAIAVGFLFLAEDPQLEDEWRMVNHSPGWLMISSDG